MLINSEKVHSNQNHFASVINHSDRNPMSVQTDSFERQKYKSKVVIFFSFECRVNSCDMKASL